MTRWRMLLVIAIPACHLVGDIEEGIPECTVDGKQNEPETDIDCGGPCTPCPDRLRCRVDSDCQSRSCFAGGCIPATCFDGRQNGLETDVDCGGDAPPGALFPCPRCFGGRACLSQTDCVALAVLGEAGSVCAGIGEQGSFGTCVSSCCGDDCNGCDDCAPFCGDRQWGAPCEIDNSSTCEFPLTCIGIPDMPLVCR